MSDPSYSQSALESTLLILSHFALVPSFIYLWLGKAYAEATFVGVLFLSSNLYHFCQAGFFCMVDSFDTMQKADHFFVYSVVFWLMMWFIGLSLETRICIFFVVQYFLFPLLLFYVHASWLGVAFVIFLVVMFFVLTGVMPNKFPEVHFSSLMILLVLLIIGVVFFILGGEPGEENYPWTHTLWHVCVMFGIFFLVDARFGNSLIARAMYYVIGTNETLVSDLESSEYALVDSDDDEHEYASNSDSDEEDEQQKKQQRIEKKKNKSKTTTPKDSSKKPTSKLKMEKDEHLSFYQKTTLRVVNNLSNDQDTEQSKILFLNSKNKRK